MNLSPGTTIAGLYRADRRIGVGGMGEVWAGVRLSDGIEVAIKVLLHHAVDANEVVARFRREAQVLARIRSKYVAQVLDFLAEDAGLVLVMELIPGDSLHAVLSYDQALAIETTLDIVSDVLRGLRDLHGANIVHRDLKPGNIVLRPRPGLRPRATLIDFGVSRIMSDPDEEEVTAITRGDRVLGTLEYMAPEQILGSRSVTGTADLYAVGAMMYRAICGHHVFGALQEGQLAVAKLNEDAPPLPTDRTDEVAERTKVLVSRLLSRRLRDRFKEANEALAEVDAIRALVPNRRPDEQSLSVDEERTLDKPLRVATTPAETSVSGPQIEIVNIRAAVPIDDIEEVSAIEQPPSLPVVEAVASTQPHVQPNTPMSAELPSYPRRPQAPEPHPWRTMVVAAALFVFGSVGGGLFGVSYAKGGLAFQIIHRTTGEISPATAAPPTVSVATPAPPASSVPVFDVGVVDIVTEDAEVEAGAQQDAEADVLDAEAESLDVAQPEATQPEATPTPPPKPPTPSPTPPKRWKPPKPKDTAPKPKETSEPPPEPKEPQPLLPEEP